MEFGPKNKAEEVVFAMEGLRVDVLCELQSLLNSKRLTAEQVEEMSGVPGIFDDDSDLTIRQLARIAHALNAVVDLSFLDPACVSTSLYRRHGELVDVMFSDDALTAEQERELKDVRRKLDKIELAQWMTCPKVERIGG